MKVEANRCTVLNERRHGARLAVEGIVCIFVPTCHDIISQRLIPHERSTVNQEGSSVVSMRSLRVEMLSGIVSLKIIPPHVGHYI